MRKQKGFFEKTRVRFAQFTFYGVFFYTFFYQQIEIPPLLSAASILGLTLVVLGVMTRSLAAGVIHKNKSLATTGLYAVVRHPLYTGSLMTAVGLAIVIRDPLFSGAMVGLFLVTYLPTIAREEARMARLFPGAWEDYAAHTPRLIPRLTALGHLRGLPWDQGQWRRNREYQAVLTVSIVIAFLYGYSVFAGL